MCSWASCSLLILTLWPQVQAGPMTQPHADVSDQQLFWGSDQYDFSVVLQAEALECFWHFAHRGENFYLNFMVRRGSSELVSNAPHLCWSTFLLAFATEHIWIFEGGF